MVFHKLKNERLIFFIFRAFFVRFLGRASPSSRVAGAFVSVGRNDDASTLFKNKVRIWKKSSTFASDYID